MVIESPVSTLLLPKKPTPHALGPLELETLNLYQLDRPEVTELYRWYFQKSGLAGRLLQLARLVVQSPENDPEMIAQLPFERARLKALADPSQPFSLMVRSVLAY